MIRRLFEREDVLNVGRGRSQQLVGFRAFMLEQNKLISRSQISVNLTQCFPHTQSWSDGVWLCLFTAPIHVLGQTGQAKTRENNLDTFSRSFGSAPVAAI